MHEGRLLIGAGRDGSGPYGSAAQLEIIRVLYSGVKRVRVSVE